MLASDLCEAQRGPQEEDMGNKAGQIFSKVSQRLFAACCTLKALCLLGTSAKMCPLESAPKKSCYSAEHIMYCSVKYSPFL